MNHSFFFIFFFTTYSIVLGELPPPPPRSCAIESILKNENAYKSFYHEVGAILRTPYNITCKFFDLLLFDFHMDTTKARSKYFHTYIHSYLNSQHGNLYIQVGFFSLAFSHCFGSNSIPHVAKTHHCNIQSLGFNAHSSHVTPHRSAKQGIDDLSLKKCELTEIQIKYKQQK